MTDVISSLLESKTKDVYEWMRNVVEYLNATLIDVKRNNEINGLELARRVNNLSFIFHEAKGDAYEIMTLTALKERMENA